MKKSTQPKEPSLLRQVIAIHFEQCRRRKAMRLLTKQEWSIDFITLLLIKAAKLSAQGINLEITSPSGIKMSISTTDAVLRGNELNDDDDIFNKLDDSAAIDAFIRAHSKRR